MLLFQSDSDPITKDSDAFGQNMTVKSLPCIMLNINSFQDSEIIVESEPISISNNLIMIKRMISDIKLSTVDDQETVEMLQSNDIIPLVYQGGFKTWECCLDLTRYLALDPDSLNGIRVLELGCGSGLPGIYALMNNAIVTFQDYNIQVLTHATLPNAILNTDQEIKVNFENGIFEHLLSIKNLKNAEFWAGDWESLSRELTQKYDLILSSETIYDSSSYNSQTLLIDHCLSPGGKVLIAAKYQYFGCSGSLTMFLNHVRRVFKYWKISTVFVSVDGIRREIIQLEKPLIVTD